MLTKIKDNLYVGPAETLDRDHVFGLLEAFIDVRTCFYEEEGDPPIWKVRWDRLCYMVDSIAYLAIEMEIPVLVFCHGGIDRSPFTMACVLASYYNMTLREAYDHIKGLRPEINIHSKWVTGWNERFDGSR